ncbi:MAG: SAM-dependent methyltransferase [Lacunisphaera sp.]
MFSNELFDAQPIHRVVWRGGRWIELGVALQGRTLREVELPAFTPELAAQAHRLPKTSRRETITSTCRCAPFPCSILIVGQKWTGLFLAFDYGKSWLQLAGEMPAGTVRTYHRHKMGNDILARPGKQDLTCHICWDWLEDGLIQAGFGEPMVESQEAFFMHHAKQKLAAITKAEVSSFSPRKTHGHAAPASGQHGSEVFRPSMLYENNVPIRAGIQISLASESPVLYS